MAVPRLHPCQTPPAGSRSPRAWFCRDRRCYSALMDEKIAAGLKLPRLEKGWVWLVGAGPGDPGLITALGLQALLDADTVLYDALVDEMLLDLAQGEKIYAGKRAGVRSCKQDEISDTLVRLA